MKSLIQSVFEAKSIEPNYVDSIIYKLKAAYCEEMLAWYQYYIAIPFIDGDKRNSVVKDYKENGEEELKHAAKLLDRIVELGGDFVGIDSPSIWNISAEHKYIELSGTDIIESLDHMSFAEKGAIETYESLMEYTKDIDEKTYKIAKSILVDENKHLEEMHKFLESITK